MIKQRIKRIIASLTAIPLVAAGTLMGPAALATTGGGCSAWVSRPYSGGTSKGEACISAIPTSYLPDGYVHNTSSFGFGFPNCVAVVDLYRADTGAVYRGTDQSCAGTGRDIHITGPALSLQPGTYYSKMIVYPAGRNIPTINYTMQSPTISY